MGAAPISGGPAIAAVIASHSHTNSVASSGGTHGMSVFDMEEEVDVSGAVAGPPSHQETASGGRGAGSLSRAWGRGPPDRKRRTWGIFAATDERSPPSSFAQKKGKRRASSGALSAADFGGSVSGETEMKISLALMAQEDEAQRHHQEQQSAELGRVASVTSMETPKASSGPRYRFR